MLTAAFFSDFSSVMNHKLFKIGDTPVSLSTLLVFVAVVIASYWLSRLARRGIEAEIGTAFPHKIEDRGINVRLQNFADSAVVFELSFWMADP